MRSEPEVSILMPTYNDSEYLSNALDSILRQAYESWELVIIDDGSTDDTEETVKQFDDRRIVYLHQENSGQLNALLNGVQHIRGRYVALLHSDDEFSDDGAIGRDVSALEDSDCDGVFGDLWNMNASGEHCGLAKTAGNVNPSSPAMLFLRGGSNIVSDVFFIRRKALDNVISTYLFWNMPYWLRFENGRIDTLKLMKTEPWYRYRLYPENYVRSEIGRFETVNGCLRTVTEIGRRISLHFLTVQRLLARAFKARTRPFFTPKPCSPHHLREMVTYTVRRYYEKVPDNIYFNGLLGFYANYPSDRTIDLQFVKDEQIFLGKDSRAFCHAMEKGSLPGVYVEILEEAAKGFGNIVVKSKEDYEKAKNSMRFLNLPVQVRKEGS